MVANLQDTTEDTTVNLAGTTDATLQKLNQSPVIFADSELRKLYLSLLEAADSSLMPSPEKNHPPHLIYQKLKQSINKLFGAAVVVILIYMTLRKTASGSDSNYRTPPN